MTTNAWKQASNPRLVIFFIHTYTYTQWQRRVHLLSLRWWHTIAGMLLPYTPQWHLYAWLWLKHYSKNFRSLTLTGISILKIYHIHLFCSLQIRRMSTTYSSPENWFDLVQITSKYTNFICVISLPVNKCNKQLPYAYSPSIKSKNIVHSKLELD